MRSRSRCGAYARSTGKPCQASAMSNGRCRNHGGLSTGPISEAGKKAVGEAARARLAAGHQERLLAGYTAWLAAGGRRLLSLLATKKHQDSLWRKTR
jgi:hypothetical protein